MNKFKLSIKISVDKERYVNERIIDSFDNIKDCKKIQNIFWEIYKLIKNQK